MVDVRTLAAAVLGVGVGVFLVAYPDAAIRLQTAGRVPTDRGGEYGRDADASDRWRRLVRLLGVASTLAGLYFAVTVLT